MAIAPDALDDVDVCDPALAIAACPDGDPFKCEWAQIYLGRDDPDGLNRYLLDPSGGEDEALRQLFPGLGDRPLSDEPIEVPEGLVYDHPSFDPYVIPVPVDWAADPYGNNSWRMNFQAFHWFYEYSGGDAAAVQAGAALLVDWMEHAFPAEPMLEQSWVDHPIAKRLDRTALLMERYARDVPSPNRRVLRAGARLILSHLYALATPDCYSRRHNHGMMQDLALLSWVTEFPALRDGQAMWDRARRRIVEDQVALSVTEDGVHIENTGSYHLFYIDLINEVIKVHQQLGAEVPDEIIQVRDRMFEPLVRLLQPDLTFAQFGDGTNEDQSALLATVLEETRELGVGDLSGLEGLAWAVSGGAQGARPSMLDRVYAHSGYAMFRDQWDFAAATTAHFKATHLTSAHYHADETAFEVFAHGRALIIEPGAYSYVVGDPYREYQRSPAAQNVLVVDNDNTIQSATHRVRVVAHGTDDGVAWVQGTHPNFEHLGVTSMVRTFVFVKPDTFVVIDHVRAPDEHDYDRHFHLHPDVTQVDEVDPRTIVASVPSGPSLAFGLSTQPDSIEMVIGEETESGVRGWYFPTFLVKVPAYDVIVSERGADVDLAAVIVITPPGSATRRPVDVQLTRQQATVTVSWAVDGAPSGVTIPAP